MSDQGASAPQAGAAAINGGTSTAGLREAAMAKRQAGGQPAPPAKQAAAKPASADASKAPVFPKKATPSADAVADSDARAAHQKLPTREREEAEPDLSAIEGDDDAPPVETVTIGGVAVPLAALSELPDEVLRKIKRKLKAGGEEIEISLAEAFDEVPKARGWQKRMWEAGQKEKALEGFAKQMGQDTIGALAKMYGVTRAQAADAVSHQLIGEIDREKMTPEERANADRMAALEAKAARVEEYERREQNERVNAKAATERSRILSDMTPALEAAGLKPTAHRVQRVAMLIGGLIDNGTVRPNDIGPEHHRWAAAEVAKELAAERAAEFPEDADGDALIAKVGEKQARAIARAYAKRISKERPALQRAAGSAPRSTGTAPPKNETWREWQTRKNAEAAKRRK